MVLPDYGAGIMGWRTLFAWLYEQADFIGQMGNLSCPLPLPDPPIGDGVVQGGLLPAGGDQAVCGPAELGADLADVDQAAGDQAVGDQSAGDQAVVGQADVDQAVGDLAIVGQADVDQAVGDLAVVGQSDVDQAGAVVHDQAGLAGL
jgi:hypothetical protein